MAMTRKDYEAIAKVIKLHAKKSQVTLGLALIFEDDNPNFDTGKFLKACSNL